MSCCPGCELRHELHRLRHSSLLCAGGYGVYRGLIDPDLVSGMLTEALTGASRTDQCVLEGDNEDVRGGQPARQVLSVDGGHLQDELFSSSLLQMFVANEVGLTVHPCGGRASYSIYAGPGAHLDVHRDVPGCDLALVTCLYDSAPSAGAGAVDLWLDDLTTPLSAIRANPDEKRSRLTLLPGDSLLIHGGLIPHRIPAPETDRLRVVSLMCFAAFADRLTRPLIRR